jgi:K+-sensing histidine kinase KdpD
MGVFPAKEVVRFRLMKSGENLIKNGLALVSVACLMFIVMAVNPKTLHIADFGIALTSIMLLIVGLVMFRVGNKREKQKKIEEKRKEHNR